MSALAEGMDFAASDQMLLRSLYFKDIKDRQTNIAASHEETFKWLLDPASPSQFVEWVRHQDGVYWITGKAGSGKSTLMKFIVGHPQVAEALKTWAGTETLITADFYFWNAGTALQKSQEGLFRSILYEILRQYPHLIRVVCASKAATLRPFERELEPWTREELWQAVEQLKDQDHREAKFCFFIDGLDEYGGDPNYIINVIESLRKWPAIKLCVSSRPWNEFVDAFGRGFDPQLTLEELTRQDIQNYVQHTLEHNPRFLILKNVDERCQELVQEIVDKARGVFLWVELVVRSLLNGLQNADRIYDLQRRLRNFPETLEKYFNHMVFSIDSFYREQIAQAFQYVITAAEPLSLLTFSILDEENLDAVVTTGMKPLTVQSIASRHDDMQRRLNGRCKGLLEIIHAEGSMRRPTYDTLMSTPKVDFLHRTAYDFLQTQCMQKMISDNLKPDFDPKRLLCKAFLAQLKGVDFRALVDTSSIPRELLEDLVFYARGLELDLGVPQVTLLDEVSKIVSRRAKCFGLGEGELGLLEFLVPRELHLYVTAALKRERRLGRLDRSKLLENAVILPARKYYNRRHDPKMVKILLEHGASPNTAWDLVVQHIHVQRPIADDDLLRMLCYLVRHGANPQHHVVIQQRTIMPRRLTGRAADWWKTPSIETRTASAQEILVEVIGRSRAEQILEAARVPSNPLLSRIKMWAPY